MVCGAGSVTRLSIRLSPIIWPKSRCAMLRVCWWVLCGCVRQWVDEGAFDIKGVGAGWCRCSLAMASQNGPQHGTQQQMWAVPCLQLMQETEDRLALTAWRMWEYVGYATDGNCKVQRNYMDHRLARWAGGRWLRRLVSCMPLRAGTRSKSSIDRDPGSAHQDLGMRFPRN